jgi:hypothetical protein
MTVAGIDKIRVLGSALIGCKLAAICKAATGAFKRWVWRCATNCWQSVANFAVEAGDRFHKRLCVWHFGIGKQIRGGG